MTQKPPPACWKTQSTESFPYRRDAITCQFTPSSNDKLGFHAALLLLRPGMAPSLARLPELRIGSPRSETPVGLALVAVQSCMLQTSTEHSYNRTAEPRQAAEEFTLNLFFEHCE